MIYGLTKYEVSLDKNLLARFVSYGLILDQTIIIQILRV
jgi:hypothetical protein